MITHECVQFEEPMGARLSPEEPAPVGHRDRGEQLAVRLAQDRLFREQRRESLRRKLAWTHKLASCGEFGCVASGVWHHFAWWIGITGMFAGNYSGSEFATMSLLVSLGIALPASAALVLLARLLERGLRRHAGRHLIELVDPSPPVTRSLVQPPFRGDRLSERLKQVRSRRMQRRIDGSRDQELGGRKYCTGAGFAALILWSVIGAILGLSASIGPQNVAQPMWEIAFTVGVLPGLLIFSVFAISTLFALGGWLNRQRLLLLAEQAGLDVTNAARAQ